MFDKMIILVVGTLTVLEPVKKLGILGK